MRTALLTISAFLILIASAGSGSTVNLPEPDHDGLTVEEAIRQRRSVRVYAAEAVTLAEISEILFAAQGVTGEAGGRALRAAPSAGATYPFEVYVFANRVEGLEPGLYRYLPHGHELEMLRAGNLGEALSEACLGQDMPAEAACTLVLAAVPERTTDVYGERGIMYVYMEAGHISQNIYLQCASLGLGAVAVGAFHESGVDALIGLDGEHESAVYVNCIGRKVATQDGE
ncbi:MAG: SagB/ThcOx family dehydrogenase [bacterium]|jgi:SagB-type dehydrogenase family enzyme